jgi:hypothetical protein
LKPVAEVQWGCFRPKLGPIRFLCRSNNGSNKEMADSKNPEQTGLFAFPEKARRLH